MNETDYLTNLMYALYTFLGIFALALGGAVVGVLVPKWMRRSRYRRRHRWQRRAGDPYTAAREAWRRTVEGK